MEIETKDIAPEPVDPTPAEAPKTFDLNFTSNGVVTTVSIPVEQMGKFNPVHFYNFLHTQGINATITNSVAQVLAEAPVVTEE